LYKTPFKLYENIYTKDTIKYLNIHIRSYNKVTVFIIRKKIYLEDYHIGTDETGYICWDNGGCLGTPNRRWCSRCSTRKSTERTFV
jgi:hypothetical protein